MAKFVVESPHTMEECQQMLDEALEKNLLDKFVFGCKSGEHIGWAYVDAENSEEALEIVPTFLRDGACIHEVSKFTPEQVKAAH